MVRTKRYLRKVQESKLTRSSFHGRHGQSQQCCYNKEKRKDKTQKIRVSLTEQQNPDLESTKVSPIEIRCRMIRVTTRRARNISWFIILAKDLLPNGRRWCCDFGQLGHGRHADLDRRSSCKGWKGRCSNMAAAKAMDDHCADDGGERGHQQ